MLQKVITMMMWPVSFSFYQETEFAFSRGAHPDEGETIQLQWVPDSFAWRCNVSSLRKWHQLMSRQSKEGKRKKCKWSGCQESKLLLLVSARNWVRSLPRGFFFFPLKKNRPNCVFINLILQLMKSDYITAGLPLWFSW